MRKLLADFVLLFLLPLTQGCSSGEFLKADCVKAEYVSASDSYCGGPDKIRILAGGKAIEALYADLVLKNDAIITSLVPQNLRTAGKVIYFKPVPSQPRICNANVPWYIEVGMVNASSNQCP